MEEEKGDRFDLGYEEAKRVISDNLWFIDNESDLSLILAWISKLDEPPCGVKAKAIRNEYTRYLAHQLERQKLSYPFTSEPPCGPLRPLSLPAPPCPSPCREPKGIPCLPAKIGAEEDDDDNLKRFSQWPLPEMPPKGKGPIKHNLPGTSKPPMLIHQGKKCIPETKPCPVPERPSPIPAGYLHVRTGEQDGPFTPTGRSMEENIYKLSRIAEAVTEETDIYEFMREIAPYSSDLGEALQTVVTEELAKFKDFVRSIYQSRMEEMQELLTKEHIKLQKRYEEWEAEVYKKAQSALAALQLTLPQFSYETYKKDPEYLYWMLKNKMAAKIKDEDAENSIQNRILRAKAQKKTFLNDEAQRIEKDNMERMIEVRELNAQLSALTDSYHTSQNGLTEENQILENKVAQLRFRLDENQKQIDELFDQLNS